MKGAIGAAALASREAYQAGMPPFSFVPLPQFCPLQGRGVKSGPICSGARQPEPAADRVNPLPRPANIASGAKLTGVFLWYRPFVRRAFG